MTLTQAEDFVAESEALNDALDHVTDYDAPTQFKGWTVNDVLVHLHYWNLSADLSATDPQAFTVMLGETVKAMQGGGLRPVENARIAARGPELRAAWIDLARDMGRRWAGFDPKMRVKWAGPDMSVRSSMTARQMETWAHGQEIFDLLGLKRAEKDRIRNIVILGVNTFEWSFRVRGAQPPGPMPTLTLTAPSGEVWRFGEGEDAIEGAAVEFAQVVTQVRNFADTALTARGETARVWMETAQCFAGPPETPPQPGTRGPARAG